MPRVAVVAYKYEDKEVSIVVKPEVIKGQKSYEENKWYMKQYNKKYYEENREKKIKQAKASNNKNQLRQSYKLLNALD